MNFHIKNEAAIRERMVIAQMVGATAMLNKYGQNSGKLTAWRSAAPIEEPP